MKHYTTTTTHYDHHHLMYLTSKFPSWEDQNPASFHQVEPFGGFIWPPRSYTCTFCRREFRSAQALGGHMNVHRRDRARLKQSSPAQQPDPEVKNQSPGLGPIFIDHNDEDLVETKLTMGLESVGFENVVCKRYKKSSSSSNSSCLLPVMNSELVCSSMEDIDLELRLGDSPAVK